MLNNRCVCFCFYLISVRTVHMQALTHSNWNVIYVYTRVKNLTNVTSATHVSPSPTVWRHINWSTVVCIDVLLNFLYTQPFKAYRLHDAPTSLTFNNPTLCPHCIYVFCIYLSTNSDLCHLQHKLIGFYNRDEKCLQRGTDRVFKLSGLLFVFKGLMWCTE